MICKVGLHNYLICLLNAHRNCIIKANINTKHLHSNYCIMKMTDNDLLDISFKIN